MRYRSKEVVEALQFTGSNCYECLAFMGLERLIVPELSPSDCPSVDTFYGIARTQPGDWILRMSGGRFDVSRKDEFAATWEPEG